MFGKSASSITDYLITSDEFDPETCKSFLQNSLKKKADVMIESIEGYQMTSSQKERILMVHSHLEFVQQSINSLNFKLDELVAPYENAVPLLCTIPRVDRSSAITITSEIGTDMTQFNPSKRSYCWAGLTPGNNESAGKKKSVRITRARVYLKPALVQCAHSAVRSTADPCYKNKFERGGAKARRFLFVYNLLFDIKSYFVNRKIVNLCAFAPLRLIEIICQAKITKITEGSKMRWGRGGKITAFYIFYTYGLHVSP